MSDERRSTDYHDRPKSRFEIDASRDSNSVDLAASADSIWRNLSLLNRKQIDEHNHHSRHMIVALFRLSMYFDNNKEAYKNFVMKRKAYHNHNQDLFLVVAAGIMKCDNPNKGRTLRYYYAQACRVLQRKKIDPDNAIDWLAQPVHVESGDKGLTGLSKTKYLWSLEPEGVEARRKKEATRQRLAAAPIRRLLGSDYGLIGKDIAATDLTNLSEDSTVLALVQFAGGKPVLKNILTSNQILMAPVVRRCLKSRTDYVRMEK